MRAVRRAHQRRERLPRRRVGDGLQRRGDRGGPQLLDPRRIHERRIEIADLHRGRRRRGRRGVENAVHLLVGANAQDIEAAEARPVGRNGRRVLEVSVHEAIEIVAWPRGFITAAEIHAERAELRRRRARRVRCGQRKAEGEGGREGDAHTIGLRHGATKPYATGRRIPLVALRLSHRGEGGQVLVRAPDPARRYRLQHVAQPIPVERVQIGGCGVGDGVG